MSDERPSLGVAAVAGAATVFSWGFILVKAMGLPGPTIAAARLLIGASFLSLVGWRLGAAWPRSYKPVLAAGLFFGAHQLIYIAATQRTSIAIVTLLGSLQPIAIAMVSRKAVGERVPRSYALWSLMAVAGVALVVGANLGDESRTLGGDLLALLNVAAFTGYFLSAKRARFDGTHTVTLTASLQWLALLFVAPALLVTEPTAPMAWQWGLIALLAFGPGNGHLLVNWAHRRVSAALSSLLLSAVPLLSSLWAHLVFGEPYGWPHVAGMALVVAAVQGARRAEAAATARSTHESAARDPATDQAGESASKRAPR